MTRRTFRISIAAAAGALQGGRLPAAVTFPTGSVVFKEIKPSVTAAADA